MYKTRLAILDMYDGTPNQGMRCIQEIIARFDDHIDEWKIFDVRGQGELPDLSYDIYISTGGPGSPYEGDGHWDRAFFDWIDNVWQWNLHGSEAKKKVFFICHSFQMAMLHFGLAEVNRRKSQSFGTFPVHMTDAGISEPFFDGLPNPFWAADFRHWQVVQPDLDRFEAMGAQILALEKIRPHVPLERAIMAVRFSEDIFGVQFHPEADGDGMLKHFLDPKRRKAIVKQRGEEKYLRMINDLSDSNKIQLTHEIVLPQFLNRAILDLQGLETLKV